MAENIKQFDYDQITNTAFGLMIKCVIEATNYVEKYKEQMPDEQLNSSAALGSAGAEFVDFMRSVEEGVKQLLDERDKG